MGLSGGSTTQTTNQTTNQNSSNTVAPSAFNLPYINSATGAVQQAYNQVAPVASGVSDALTNALPSLGANVIGGAGSLGAANGYTTDVLNGKYLGAGNPYLAGQIAATNQDVGNSVNSAFGAAGRTGSGANTFALAKALANNETNLRYTDYSNERNAMGQAASLAPNLSAQGLGSFLTAAQSGITLPQQVASTYAGGLGSLIGGYNTSDGSGTSTTNGTTTTQSNPGLLQSLGQLAQIGSLFGGGGGGATSGLGSLLSAGTSSGGFNNIGSSTFKLPSLY